MHPQPGSPLPAHRAAARTHPGRALVLTLCLGLLQGTSCIEVLADPVAGLPEYQEIGTLPVPGGARLNVMGGNLMLSRTDLSIDTQLGPFTVGATWNSATREWRWSFDGAAVANGVFTDATGAAHRIDQLANGAAIPGTHWVRTSYNACQALQVKTKGGLQHEFRCDGRPLYVRWSSSYEPYLQFDPAWAGDGQLHTTAIRQCLVAPGGCHPVFDISYDAQGRVTQIADRAGRTARFAYDASGRLSQARDALDIAEGWPGTRYTYDATGALTSVTNSEGERVEYDYGAGHRRLIAVRQIGLGNPTQQFHYEGKNANGLFVTRWVDALGRETRFRYDGSRQLFEVETMATGDRLTRTWSSLRPTSLRLPDGTTTHWTWIDDDVATRTDAAGNVTTYTHAPNGVDREQPWRRAIAQISDSVGLVARRSYDAAGRLVRAENGAGDTTTFTYGADQMIATKTLPSGVAWGYAAYGEHGRAAQVTYDGNQLAIVYDAVGNRLDGDLDGEQPEIGGVVSREYDADRNLSALLIADHVATIGAFLTEPERIEIEHRSDGRRRAIRRPGGGDHEFDYDALGRLIAQRERVDGTWRTTSYEYDAQGRPLATQLANGMRRATTYDAGGRIASFSASQDGATEGIVGFAYTNGRLTMVYDTKTGMESYGYDFAGRLQHVQHPDGERSVYEHDARSRRTREVFTRPDSSVLETIEYDYDLADREIELRQAGTRLLTRTYANGRVSAVAYGNGLVREFRYDADTGFPTGATTRNVLGAVVESTESYQELLGVWLEVFADTTTSAGVAGRTLEAFDMAPPVPNGGIDNQGVRVGATMSETFSYDSLSNRTSYWDPDGEFTYNAERNRLLGYENHGTPIAYTYDAAGFVTSRGGVPLTWTPSGRLASHGSTSLQWNMRGGLIQSTIAGQTARFLWGGRIQTNAAGNPVALDLGEVRVCFDATHLYRHYDFRRNVKFTTNDSGLVVSHYRYDAWRRDALLGADDDPFRFVGRQEIGDLMILGARIYDPLVGRFLSPDPILDLVNQYTYTLGNPIWFADATGEITGAQVSFIMTTQGLLFALIAVAAGPVTPLAFGIAGFATILGILGAAAGMSTQGGGSSGAVGLPGGGAGDGAGSGAGSGAGASPGVSVPGIAICAPSSLLDLPDTRKLLWPLVGVQLVLGALVLRRRRRAAAPV